MIRAQRGKLFRPARTRAELELIERKQLTENDWHAFAATMEPNTDPVRTLGHYTVAVRKKATGDQ